MSIAAALPISNSFSLMSLEKSDSIPSAICQIYPHDSLKKILDTVQPSAADRWAFAGKEIASKSYVELSSGRGVEVLTFKDQLSKCIGSFSSVAKESCQEGFAVYDQATDTQWCQLISALVDEKVEEAEDWSCGWNSMQNALYLQTGMKCTFLEMLQFFIGQLHNKTEPLASKLAKVQTAEDLQQFSKKEGLAEYVMHLCILFYEEPLLRTLSSLTHQIFFQAKGTQRQLDLAEDNVFSDVEWVTEKELIQQIKNHPFVKDGPLFFTANGESLFLTENQDRKMIVIDPHNFKRDPAFSALRQVQDWEISGTQVSLRTQDMNGKTVVYRRVENVTGLHRDINYGPLTTFLADIRKSAPLSVDELSEQLSKLATDFEAFDKSFTEVNARLNPESD